jgi:PAS domain S-box-containing protein
MQKNGSVIDTEINIQQIEFEGKSAFQVLVQNIGIRKQAERELLSFQETLKERVLERTAELENYRVHLEDVVETRTSRLRNTVSLLRKEIEERILAEERAEHLKLTLRAIRSINLLITTETDSQALINGACKSLVETRGYKDAWIFLKNQDGSYLTASEARYSENLEPLKTSLMNGLYTPCVIKTLDSAEPWTSDAERNICSDCALVQTSKEPRHIMACRLQSHNRIFGALTVTSLGAVPPDTEEIELFKEVCDDIAFALDNIEHEKAEQKTAIALEESEDRYKALFENSGMAIFFMQEEIILDCNTKAAEVFKCCKQDLIGLSPGQMSPLRQPDGKLSSEQAIENVKAAINTRPQYFNWIHSRMNGEVFPAEISLNAVEIGGRNYIQATVNDITAKDKAETALRESENNYRTLSNNVPVGIFRSDPRGEGTLLAVNPMMAMMMGYDSPDALLHKSSESLFAGEKFRELFLAEMEASTVVENHETLMRRADGSEFWASISARFFNPDGDRNSFLIDGIVKDISEGKTYADNLRSSLASLKKTIEGTVSAMSFLVEIKDPYTSGHQKGVSLLACAIGKEMGLNEDTIDCIRIASSLHDLGKLNVPLEVLSKPGSLNDFEIEFLRTHPRAGYDILKSIEFPWPIAEVILQHHERKDGSGYPNGLKGDEIRIEARIIAVADVVEATASRRPYRASRGINVALEAVNEGAGTVFDKEAVDCCLRLFLEKGFSLIDHDGETIRADVNI